MNGGIFLWRKVDIRDSGCRERAGVSMSVCAKLAKKLGSAIKTPSHLFPIQTYFTSNVQKKSLSAIDILEIL